MIIIKDNQLVIPQATEKGYELCEPNGVFDISYPSSKTRRGRVQNGGEIAPALMCNSILCLYENKNDIMNNNEKPIKVDNVSCDSQAGAVYSSEGISQTLCACTHGYAMGNIQEPVCAAMRGREPRVEQVGNIVDDTNINFKNPQRGRVYNSNGVSPALNCCQGGGLEPKIVEPICLNSKVDGKQPSLENRIYDSEGISTAVTTCFHPNILEPKDYVMFKGKEIYDGDGLYTGSSERFQHGGLKNVSRTLKANINDADVCVYPRIRKLTPKECFRLMGVDDKDIDKLLNSGISNSQLYKLAGNSIVVDCLAAIFNKMFLDKKDDNKQLSLF